MAVESSQPSLGRRRSAVRSGVGTGVSVAIVSGAAALAGAYLAHKFGRDAETDGFLAAYSVYLVIAIAAQAFRLVIVPDLTRAQADGRLTAEFVSYVTAFLVVAVPVTVLTWLLADQLGELLTGTLPESAASIASRALVWVVPAAFLQLLAALAASALASEDSYLTAAAGYALGGLAGLVVFVVLASEHGLIALAWGLVLNGSIAFGLPLSMLVARGFLRGARRGGVSIAPRLWRLVQAAAVPLALQGLYLIALRGASGLGEGNQTSLTYAFLFASTLVAMTASSLSLISSAPLTRRGVDAESAATHVVNAGWLSLAVIGVSAGIFALVGGRVMTFVLGDAFSGDVGSELGHLVVWLAPWMVASVAFSVTFPLLFVVEKPRVLIPVAIAALAVHVPISLALRAAFELPGLALALAITTFGVIVVLMAAVSPRMLGLAASGFARIAAIVVTLTVASFGLASLVLGDVLGAFVGAALYLGALYMLRPRGLVEAVRYVRALHH